MLMASHKDPMRFKPSQPIPEAVWQDPLYFIAFGFGSGAVPIAPGTFGTLMAIPFYLVLRHLPLAYYLLFVGMIILLSSWICQRVSVAIGVHDHQGMCLDEFAGFFVTMIGAPVGFGWILAGFLLFRLFDIWKPGIIKLIDQKMDGGLGMILDDVVAGLFAMVILQSFAFFMTS